MNNRYGFSIMLVPIALLSMTAFAGTYSGGLGTDTKPYRIGTAADWQELTNTPADWNAHFILINDIDLGETVLTPIGNNIARFTGDFDGDGYVVRNATIIAPDKDYIGLFGYIGAVGQVTHLGVVNVDIHGHEAVGGLVGRNHGIIDFCYVTGTVRGEDWDTGGLAGSNMGGAIYACYADVAVSSSSEYVGGLVGYNLGDIVSSSYSVGAVSGLAYVGGFVGANDKGYIFDCYSTGAATGILNNVGGFAGINWAGIIEACFWDIQISGTIAGNGGQGKTTAEMQSEVLYLNAGWDFDYVWTICDGLQYPKLQWQISAADFVCPYGVGMEDFAFLSSCWLMSVQLEGDITGDDIVNGKDFQVLSSYWLRQDCGDCGGADLTGDGAVGVADLLLMSDQWLLRVADLPCSAADLDGDGVIGLSDLLQFADQWLR